MYASGRVGPMVAMADSTLANGGLVTGMLHKSLLDREIAQTGLGKRHIVDNMHRGTNVIAELSSGFIALSGGAGTAEELFEQWTLAQSGIHNKSCAFLNVKHF